MYASQSPSSTTTNTRYRGTRYGPTRAGLPPAGMRRLRLTHHKVRLWKSGPRRAAVSGLHYPSGTGGQAISAGPGVVSGQTYAMFASKVARPGRSGAASELLPRRNPQPVNAGNERRLSGPAWDFSQIPLFPAGSAIRDHALRPFAGIVQAKLAAGNTNDPLEHEADRIAEYVLRMPAATIAPTLSAP